MDRNRDPDAAPHPRKIVVRPACAEDVPELVSLAASEGEDALAAGVMFHKDLREYAHRRFCATVDDSLAAPR